MKFLILKNKTSQYIKYLNNIDLSFWELIEIKQILGHRIYKIYKKYIYSLSNNKICMNILNQKENL